MHLWSCALPRQGGLTGANSVALLVLPVQCCLCSHRCPTSKPWGRKLEIRVEYGKALSAFTCAELAEACAEVATTAVAAQGKGLEGNEMKPRGG